MSCVARQIPEDFDVVVCFFLATQKKNETNNSRQLTKLVGFLVKASFVGD